MNLQPKVDALSLKEGDIIIVTAHDDFAARRLAELRAPAHIKTPIGIIRLRPGETIETADESRMRAAGWKRIANKEKGIHEGEVPEGCTIFCNSEWCWCIRP